MICIFSCSFVYLHVLDSIGNRELEGRSPSKLSWWGGRSGFAATTTPPKRDSWGPAAPKPPPRLLPIKSILYRDCSRDRRDRLCLGGMPCLRVRVDPALEQGMYGDRTESRGAAGSASALCSACRTGPSITAPSWLRPRTADRGLNRHPASADVADGRHDLVEFRGLTR